MQQPIIKLIKYPLKNLKNMTVKKDKAEKIKKVHAELKDLLSNRFNIIKSSLGIQNDAEVIRFLIQYYYHKKFELKDILKVKDFFIKGTDPKEDREVINKFFERYGEAFRKLGEH